MAMQSSRMRPNLSTLYPTVSSNGTASSCLARLISTFHFLHAASFIRICLRSRVASIQSRITLNGLLWEWGSTSDDEFTSEASSRAQSNGPNLLMRRLTCHAEGKSPNACLRESRQPSTTA
eukprot:9367688-Pyramimonas_sp.AAC.1